MQSLPTASNIPDIPITSKNVLDDNMESIVSTIETTTIDADTMTNSHLNDFIHSASAINNGSGTVTSSTHNDLQMYTNHDDVVYHPGDCTPNSFESTYKLRYQNYTPRNNHRTLLVVLYPTVPKDKLILSEQKTRQSVIDHLLHSRRYQQEDAKLLPPEWNDKIDVAILYYFSESGSHSIRQHDISRYNQMLSSYYGGRTKHIWPINITSYVTDWGKAIDHILTTKPELYPNININSWRFRILKNIRQGSTEDNLFGGVRPCYLIQSRFTSNKTCIGTGLSKLFLYHSLHEILLRNEQTATTTAYSGLGNSSTITPGRRLIEMYDRFIITHSDTYHVCDHPAVTTLSSSMHQNDTLSSFYLDPSYIWTPSAVSSPTKSSSQHADQLGIPLTHWILSYQHIQYGGALNILSNLLQNYELYIRTANLANLNVQRLVRTVWQHRCLLPLHKRFHRTIVSTISTTTTDIRPDSVTGLRYKYPGEIDLATQVCNDSAVNFNSTTAFQTLKNPNSASPYAMSTASVDNTSFIYPVSCNTNEDQDTTFVLPISNKEIHNRTLVIIMGNLRGGEIAWNTMYKNLLDFNNADLALLIGDTNPVYINSSMFQRAKYYWKVQEYNDWNVPLMQMINETLLHVTNENYNDQYQPGDNKNKIFSYYDFFYNNVLPFADKREGLFGGLKGHKGSGAIIMIIRFLLQKKIRELDLIHQYERFVVTRADHYYLCPHKLDELSLQYMWTPGGASDYYGVTDRHLVVSNKLILRALDIFPTLFRNFNTFIGLNIETLNPERLIKYAWHVQCLEPYHKTFERVMFTCGTSSDTTRWKKLEVKVSEGVLLKYPTEYFESQGTCRSRLKRKSSSG